LKESTALLDQRACLSLNFKRGKFFPALLLSPKYSNKKKVLLSASLGLVGKSLSLKRSQLKKKSTYISLSNFFKKIIFLLDLLAVKLIVKGTAKHLISILDQVFSTASSIFKNPFTQTLVPELSFQPKESKIKLSKITFLKPYPYCLPKPKKKGRLKRKITKRLIKLNSVVD